MSRLSFTEALDQALELLEQGHPLEFCVRQFPEYTDELRPLLQVSDDLHRLADARLPVFDKASIEPDWETLLADVPQTPPNRLKRYSLAIIELFRSLQYHPVQRYATLAAAVIILLVVGWRGSEQSHPRSPLYQIKQLTERVELGVALSPEREVERRIEFARRRLEELQTITNQTHEIDPELLRNALVQAQGAVKAAEQGGVGQEFYDQLASLLSDAQTSISQLKVDLPEPQVAVLNNADLEVAELREDLNQILIAESGVTPTATPTVQPITPTPPAPSPTRTAVTPPATIVPSAEPDQEDGVIVSPTATTPATNVPTRSTPTPTATTAVPTPRPTVIPTAVPTVIPTPEPTPEPTLVPTAVPTQQPTAEPTLVPTEEPTPVPTAEPTVVPTEEPTSAPTAEPTLVPTEEPTAAPTAEPTVIPTEEPTLVPTEEPTAAPTETVVPAPSDTATPLPTPTEETPTPPVQVTITLVPPTARPTTEPTTEPTEEPTATETVTIGPTDTTGPLPTAAPTTEPTEEPTPTETTMPTEEPTAEPTPTEIGEPTTIPTDEPPGLDNATLSTSVEQVAPAQAHTKQPLVVFEQAVSQAQIVIAAQSTGRYTDQAAQHTPADQTTSHVEQQAPADRSTIQVVVQPPPITVSALATASIAVPNVAAPGQSLTRWKLVLSP